MADRSTYLRNYRRKWMAARRTAFFAGKSCAKCGSIEALELDHIDPALKVDHRVWSWAKERREAELAKCQALCGPCHIEKTRRQRREQQKALNDGHGTSWGYKHGCRCSECVEWNRARRRRQRRQPSSR